MQEFEVEAWMKELFFENLQSVQMKEEWELLKPESLSFIQ